MWISNTYARLLMRACRRREQDEIGQSSKELPCAIEARGRIWMTVAVPNWGEKGSVSVICTKELQEVCLAAVAMCS